MPPPDCAANAGKTYDCDEIDDWQCYSDQVQQDCCHTCYDVTQNVNNNNLPGCQYGDRQGNCSSYIGSTAMRCYNNTTREACCDTCFSLETDVQGCTWGDRVTGCDARVGPNGRSCYDNTIRNECCYTCTKFETDIQGCKYGDRAGGCRSTSCWTTQQRYDCCATCNDSDTTWSVTGTTTPYTTSEVTPVPGVTSGQQTSTPAWVIPVVAGAAGVIVVLVIILVACFLIRRRRKKPDAISDEMYKEYKMSKRAPVAPPRPEPEEERRSKLMRQDSAEYAYINPEDVQSDPGSDKNDLKKRTGNDHLPENPKEYVYLTNPDKYGYLQPVERPRNPDPYTDLQGQGRQPDPYTHLHHANEEERRRQNSYGDFPQAAHYSRGNVVKSEKL